MSIEQLAVALNLTYMATAKRLRRYRQMQLLHEPDPKQRGVYCLTDTGVDTLDYIKKTMKRRWGLASRRAVLPETPFNTIVLN